MHSVCATEGKRETPLFPPYQIKHQSSMIYCSTESENPSDLNTKWEKNIIKSLSPQLTRSLWQEGWDLWISSIMCQMFRITFWVYNVIIWNWTQAEGCCMKGKQLKIKMAEMCFTWLAFETLKEYFYSILAPSLTEVGHLRWSIEGCVCKRNLVWVNQLSLVNII